jgi:hypothetical protein
MKNIYPLYVNPKMKNEKPEYVVNARRVRDDICISYFYSLLPKKDLSMGKENFDKGGSEGR